MKKKFFGLMMMGLLSLSLAACNNPQASSGGNTPSGGDVDPSGDTDHSGGGPSTPSDSDIINSVMANISIDSFATSGAMKYWMRYEMEGEEPIENENVNRLITSVYNGTNTFIKLGSPYDTATSDTRYDAGPDNEILIFQLNPLSNEVEALFVQDYATGLPVPYTEAFGFPINKKLAPYSFTVNENKLVLEDPSAINFNYLYNVCFGGQTMRNQLMTFEIGFDKDYKPTTLYIEFGMENEYMISKDIYDGVFIDPASVEVDPLPRVRAAQPGQEKLQAYFNSLQEMNYTVEVTYVTKYPDEDYFYLHDDEPIAPPISDDEGDEGSEEPPVIITTYVTPSGYYHDCQNWYNGSDGAIETDAGLIEFKKDKISGVFNATATAKQIRTVEDKFGDFWKYSARSFNVTEDGKYVIANEKGFEKYLWTNLTTEATVYGPTIPFGITFTIDEDNNQLIYEYGDDYTSVRGVVKNIGTTVLPVSISEVNPFTPATNWNEWYNQDTNWNQHTYDILNVLTENNPDIIPYIYTPYDFERLAYSEGDSEFVMEPYPHIVETIEQVRNFTTAYQCDTCDEAVRAYNETLSQIENANAFKYDRQKDCYRYVTETLDLTMRVYIDKDFVGQIADEKFNFALIIDVVNNNFKSNDPYAIEI